MTEHIKDILCPDCNENAINVERYEQYGKCRTCQRREILCKTKGTKYIKYKDLPQSEKDRLQKIRNIQMKHYQSKKQEVELTPFGTPIPEIKMRNSPNQIYTSEMVRFLLKVADGTQTATELRELLIAEFPNKDVTPHNLNNIVTRYNIPYKKRKGGKPKKIEVEPIQEMEQPVEEPEFDVQSFVNNLEESLTELSIGDSSAEEILDDVSYEQIDDEYNKVAHRTERQLEPARFEPIKAEVDNVLANRFKQSRCFLDKNYSVEDYINMLEMLYYLSSNTDTIIHSRQMQYGVANKYQDDILHAMEMEISNEGNTYLVDKMHVLRNNRRYYEYDRVDVIRMRTFLKSIDIKMLKTVIGQLKRNQIVRDTIKFVPSVDSQMVEQYDWAVDEIPFDELNKKHNEQISEFMENNLGIEPVVEKNISPAKTPTNKSNKKKEKEKKPPLFRVSCKISGGGYGAFAHWHNDYSCPKAETALAYASNTLNQLKHNRPGLMWTDLDVVPLNIEPKEPVTVVQEESVEEPKPLKPQPLKPIEIQTAQAMDREIIEFKTSCVTTKYLEDTTSGLNLKRFRVASDVTCAGFDKPRTWKKIYMCTEPELAVKDAKEMLYELQYKYPNVSVGEIRIEEL